MLPGIPRIRVACLASLIAVALLHVSFAVAAVIDMSLTQSPVPTPVATPTTTEVPAVKTQTPRPTDPKAVLTIHKKFLPPSWGRVLQFRKYETKTFSEKNRETLYEFVLQDADGIVRVATYHETVSGEGYWEVLVWDQP